jgi:hypothetical protein
MFSTLRLTFPKKSETIQNSEVHDFLPAKEKHTNFN